MGRITPDYLTQRAKNPIAALQRYMSKKNDHTLFCFVEGINDSDYYLDKVRFTCGEDYYFIDCNGKDGVMYIYNTTFSQDHQRVKMAFFIDKDFDDALNDENIFETDCYSIENYYCSEATFKRVLQNEFKVSDTESMEKALRFYHERYDDFHETTLLFNAFVSAVRKKSKKTGVKILLQLNDRFPSLLADIKIDGCSKKYDLPRLYQEYHISINEVPVNDVIDEERALKSRCPFSALRGKYEINYMCMLLKFLIQDANDKNKQRIIHQKIHTTIIDNRIMANLSRCADYPNSLRDYLKKFTA